MIGIPYSYYSPQSYVETNIGGTLNVLQAAIDNGVSRVIHTSTSEVYGTAISVPISESHPLQGQSPYSATKIGADQLAFSFQRSFGLPVTIIRPFNTYGPRQSSRAIIPATIIQILSKEKKIKLGDMTPTRDFTYIQDTVNGFLSTLKPLTSIDGEVINLGSNFEISIEDTVKKIVDIIGFPVEIVRDEDRMRPIKSEVSRLWADNSKARELLGWQPNFQGLEGFQKGLIDTIEWFEKNKNIVERFYNSKIYAV